MLRAVSLALRQGAQSQMRSALPVAGSAVSSRGVVQVVGGKSVEWEHESDSAFDQRFMEFFSRKDLDGWLVRKGLSELHGHDVVPEPELCIVILQAIRRINDLALAVRFLEAVRFKCGNKVDEIYPWILQEIKPTLDELGIPTLDKLGYEKPELFLPDADYWDWEKYGDAHTKFYNKDTKFY